MGEILRITVTFRNTLEGRAVDADGRPLQKLYSTRVPVSGSTICTCRRFCADNERGVVLHHRYVRP